MKVFSGLVLSHLDDHGLQSVADPSNGAELFWRIRPPVQIIGTLPESLRFLEADPSFPIRPKPRALFAVELEPYHMV